jgi:hypothetical protein
MRLQREGDQERRTARSKPPLESSLQTRAQLVDDLETVARLNIHGVLSSSFGVSVSVRSK